MSMFGLSISPLIARTITSSTWLMGTSCISDVRRCLSVPSCVRPRRQRGAQRVCDRFGDIARAVRVGMAVVLDAVVGVERHVDVRQTRLLDDAPPQLALLRL